MTPPNPPLQPGRFAREILAILERDTTRSRRLTQAGWAVIHFVHHVLVSPVQQEGVMTESFPRRSLFDTEERTLFCDATGREYHLSVALPETYATSNQSYPVIYLLDSDIFFGMAAGLTPLSHWCVGTPEAIVVGIGYDMQNYAEWMDVRGRDFFIPDVVDWMPEDPNFIADRFLTGLTQEIIPFIETNYRASSFDRCLYGYSASGFFTLYALFHQPQAFQRYMCGSVMNLAYPYLIQHTERLAARSADEPIWLYTSVGELESKQVPSYHQLIDFLRGGNFPCLKLSTEIYPGEYHGSEGAALTYLHGIRNVYPAPESLPESALG